MRGRVHETSSSQRLLKSFAIAVLAAIYLMPFYIAITYSLKTPQETAASPLGLPTELAFQNYTRAIEVSNFFSALVNSTIVTVGTVVIVILTAGPAAYAIQRRLRRGFGALYFLFIGSIVLPFQVVMFPLYRNLRSFGLLNTLPGLMIAISGLQLGFCIFLYAGFVRSVPLEIEESAMVDGAGRLRVFWSIVFPLLRPVTLTVGILTAITAWNDFQTALILVQRPEVRTLPLMQYFFFGQYSIEINMAFAAFTLAMIPIVLFYFIVQKYIESGLTAGALKG